MELEITLGNLDVGTMYLFSKLISTKNYCQRKEIKKLTIVAHVVKSDKVNGFYYNIDKGYFFSNRNFLLSTISKNMFNAGYIGLFNSGELRSKISALENLYQKCTICPHQCKIDRFSKERGKCNTSAFPLVSSAGPHFGEESPLVGFNGSGTIFMTNCNLRCIFCQNYDISQLGNGEEVSYEQLSETMILLQDKGCHNINIVTPTHQVYAILRALELAIPKGLNVPLVYNSGGYDLVDTLKILEGVFDIYMPDFKYFYAYSAKKSSGIEDYPETAMAAIQEMHRQVGDLVTDTKDIAQSGMIIRHLVLPGHYKESRSIIDFISELSSNTYFNLMDQYRPEFKAIKQPILNTRVTSKDFQELFDYAMGKGLHLAM